MFELAVRLLLAGGTVLVAGLLKWTSFDAVWMTAACVCGYSLAGYWLETRDQKNAGFAGLIACLDAIGIASLLAATGTISQFGFLVLAPCAFAAAKYGSLPSAMAPVAAFTLLGADQWANKGAPPGPQMLAHALGVLAIGLLLNHRRIIVSVAKPVLPEQVEPLQTEEPEAYMELRESFRKLKDMYQNLERKSRRDRFAADLRTTLNSEGGRFHKRLAAQLKKLSNADGLSLYTLAGNGSSTVLRAVEGAIAEPVRQAVLQIDAQEAIAMVRENSEKALQALADPGEAGLMRNVVITCRGRMVGLIAVQGDTGERLESAVEALEEIAPIIGEILHEGVTKELFESRLKRAELLYELASAEAGASSKNALADRVIRELADIVDAEHLSVAWIEGAEILLASTQGTRQYPLSGMSFAEGPDVAGWLAIGAPEIVAYDIADDARCRRAEMSKQRIQSVAIFPIGTVGTPEGYLAATSPRSGAIDDASAESLRLAAAELSQSLTRLSDKPEGLTTAAEFQQRIAGREDGCLVYLEPLRREDLAARYGRPAIEIALKALAHRLRAELPRGAAMYRRSEGDYIVYLPGISEAVARQWANEAAALASLVGIPVLESGRRAPFAVRAKVASLTAQEPEEAVGATA